MNAAQTRDIKDLREAARARNQEQAQFLTKRLLQQMDYYVALAVVVERLHHFLDIFESYYPDERWVRTLLLAITNYGTTPDDSIAEAALQQPFSEPGAGNYIKAIYDLTQAMQKKHTPEARVGFMTSAIVNGIMAELAEAYYGEHWAAWQQVRENAPNAQQIAYAFWTSQQTAALDSAAWLEVADSLAQKLSRGASRA